MAVNKTTRIQHDTPTKNRFIGAMEATGKLRESTAKYGIKPATSGPSTKTRVQPKTFRVLGDHQSFRIVGDDWWYETA